jgi:hypothetical protein
VLLPGPRPAFTSALLGHFARSLDNTAAPRYSHCACTV